ncbi:MAG: hypothetical protein JOZ52_12045 [Acidobacteria bacterium]|nr:hypothetical protein [Acidobacteriota bacterium]
MKEEKISPGSLRFEGTIMNTGSINISRLVVAADISELSFEDAELNGCQLESRIAEIRNLKAGESRSVIWHFTHSPNQLRCGRKVHNGESFDYTVDWTHYRWNVKVVEIE